MLTDRLRNATQNDAPFRAMASIIDRSSLRGIDMKRFILALTAISSGLLFTACGQSGPLYLPGNPSKIQNVPNTPADTQEEDSEEKERDDASED